MTSDNNVYKQNGYDSREDYLQSLAAEHGDAIYDLADLLGEEEDFDGLVTLLGDI